MILLKQQACIAYELFKENFVFNLLGDLRGSTYLKICFISYLSYRSENLHRYVKRGINSILFMGKV